MLSRAYRSTGNRVLIQSEPEQPGQGLTTPAPLHCSLHYLTTNGAKR